MTSGRTTSWRIAIPICLTLVLFVPLLASNVFVLGRDFWFQILAQSAAAVLVTLGFFGKEGSHRPTLITHFRHASTLYACALFGWALQGEGYTAAPGRAMAFGAMAMIVANALSLVRLRYRKQ